MACPHGRQTDFTRTERLVVSMLPRQTRFVPGSTRGLMLPTYHLGRTGLPVPRAQGPGTQVAGVEPCACLGVTLWRWVCQRTPCPTHRMSQALLPECLSRCQRSLISTARANQLGDQSEARWAYLHDAHAAHVGDRRTRARYARASPWLYVVLGSVVPGAPSWAPGILIRAGPEGRIEKHRRRKRTRMGHR